MATSKEKLDLAADLAEAASQLIHDFANGDENTEVPTENGPIPTLAKLSKFVSETASVVVEQEVSVVASVDPAPNKIVRAGVDGKIDSDWISESLIERPEFEAAVTRKLANYNALRNYSGDADAVEITQSGMQGTFYRLPSGQDNNGTIIVDGTGQAWGRVYAGAVYACWFGAKGDNATNDTLAIQAAIDFVSSIGGGVVQLLSGVHLVSGLTTYNDVIIAGMGKQATRIKLVNGANNHVIATKNFDTLAGTSPASGDIGVMTGGLKSLTVDGNGDNQTDQTKHGFAYFGIDPQLEEVAIKSCRGWGLWVEAPGVFYTPGGWYGYGRNSQSDIRGVEAYESWQGNFYYNGQSDSSMFNVLCYRVRGVREGIAYDTTKPHGSNMWVGPKSTGIRVFGSHFWGDSLYGVTNEAHSAYFEQCHSESASVAKVWAKARTIFRGHIYEVADKTSAYAIKIDGTMANFSRFDVEVSGCLNWVSFPEAATTLIDIRAHGWVPNAVMYTGTFPTQGYWDVNNQSAGSTSRRFVRPGSVEADRLSVTGGINMKTSTVDNAKAIAFNGWANVAVSSATLTVGSGLSALTASAAIDVTDITSSAAETGLIQLTFRNSGAAPITFKNLSTKLRNIGQVDKVLNQHDSITYVHITGAVWQQVGGK